MNATNKTANYTPRLKKLFEAELRQAIKKELKLENVHQVPLLEKIVVSVGLGRGKDDKALLEAANNTLRKITAQQPIDTYAKKAIASFKLREGNKIGLKVTLRGNRMYEFLDRLISVVLPRVRDFHGIPTTSFDKSGNYSLGLVEQSVFPELAYEDTVKQHGVQITFVITGGSSQKSHALLSSLGLPFEKPHRSTSKESK